MSRSKDLPWYQSKLGSSLTPAGRALLETYSGIPSSEVEAHIYKNVNNFTVFHYAPADTDKYQRDSAWEIFPWPCVGSFWFMALGLSLHPHYNALLTRLRTQDPPTKFLDLGTCFGQDLRKLIADGAPRKRSGARITFPNTKPPATSSFATRKDFKIASSPLIYSMSRRMADW